MSDPTIVNVVVAVEVNNQCQTPEAFATKLVRYHLRRFRWMDIHDEGTIDPIATEAASEPTPESMVDQGVTA